MTTNGGAMITIKAVRDAQALFGRSYAQARNTFLEAASARGLPVHTHELELPGAQGEALATDVVLDGPADADKMLVVISGVHGVEGYCGSALQTGFLLGALDGSLPRPPDVAVLHVHAINPHGFSHGRRVTQENVDLNRNFVDFDQPLPDNAAYAQVHDHLLPAQWPPTAETERALLDYREQHGERGLQRAAWLGQYSHPDGVCWGGHAPTWSNRTFREILRRHAANVRGLGSIDIHTGLGPYGVGERIFASFHDEMLEHARRWWGALTSVQTGSSTSVAITGPIQAAIHAECAAARHAGMCLEYGTWPMHTINLALRADHWRHRQRDQVPEDVARSIHRELVQAFYPDAADWRSTVWAQGAQAYAQALAGLSAWRV